VTRFISRRNVERIGPEARLYAAMVAAILFPIGKYDGLACERLVSLTIFFRLFHIRVDGITQYPQLDRPNVRDPCVHHSLVHYLSRRLLLSRGHVLHIRIIGSGGTKFVQ
jgi:hypothetical protein